MPYADATQLIADYIPDAKSAAEIAAVGRILASVSAFVDTYCRRESGYFTAASVSASDKRIRGMGERFLQLPVHVFGSITAVEVYGTAIDTANYYESDRNGWLYTENTASNLIEGFGRYDLFEDGEIYTVTARWGYESTPADIAEAVRLTTKAVWESQKGVLGEVTPDGFVVERALPLFAREVLDNYRRREFEV